MSKATIIESYALEISDQKIACYETKSFLIWLFPGALLFGTIGYLSLVDKYPPPTWFSFVFLASGVLIFLFGLSRLFQKTKVLVWSCDHANFEFSDALAKSRSKSRSSGPPRFVIPIRDVKKLILADRCVCDGTDGEVNFQNAIVAIVLVPDEQKSLFGKVAGAAFVDGLKHVLLGIPAGREFEVESILRTQFLVEATEFERRSVFRF